VNILIEDRYRKCMRTRQEKNHEPAVIWLLPQYASCEVSSLVIARMVYDWYRWYSGTGRSSVGEN
jgi:hypothetical protein